MAIEVEGLRERIKSAESLYSIVETMRALATVNIRRANQAASAAREYLRSVHIALYVALEGRRAPSERRPAGGRSDAPHRAPASAPPPVRSRGAHVPPTLLVLSSNQGLCGTFNERVTNRALTLGNQIARSLGIDRSELSYVCVGYRGADRLEASGVRVVSVFDAPASVEAVGPLVRKIYAAVAELLEPGGRLLGVYNQMTSGSTFAESEIQLFPLEPGRWRELPEGEAPFATIPLMAGRSPDIVLPDLVRELLFIDLYRILVESFAAENAARMISMQGATENIDELLAELGAAYRAARQDAITNELMDILGGLFAMEGRSP